MPTGELAEAEASRPPARTTLRALPRPVPDAEPTPAPAEADEPPQVDDADDSGLSSLLSPAVCADADLLKAEEPMPDSPDKRVQVTDVRVAVEQMRRRG